MPISTGYRIIRYRNFKINLIVRSPSELGKFDFKKSKWISFHYDLKVDASQILFS